MSNLESRIAKLEEAIGAPGCVCEGRRERFVILDETGGPLTPEQLEVERSCRWICPAHGPSQVRYLLHIRLSEAGQAQRDHLQPRLEQTTPYSPATEQPPPAGMMDREAARYWAGRGPRRRYRPLFSKT